MMNVSRCLESLLLAVVCAGCAPAPPPDEDLSSQGRSSLLDGNAEPMCACKYAANDPSVSIVRDDCPAAQVCANATCVVDVNRAGTVTRETEPCESLSPPAPPEPKRCASALDCPVGHACHDDICRKRCESHADCTAPDKCFVTFVSGQVCLNEDEYRCGTYVQTACIFFRNDGPPDCLTGAYTYDQHANHGNNNVYCDLVHEVNACRLNAAKNGCVLAPVPRRCWATYFE